LLDIFYAVVSLIWKTSHDSKKHGCYVDWWCGRCRDRFCSAWSADTRWLWCLQHGGHARRTSLSIRLAGEIIIMSHVKLLVLTGVSYFSL